MIFRVYCTSSSSVASWFCKGHTSLAVSTIPSLLQSAFTTTKKAADIVAINTTPLYLSYHTFSLESPPLQRTKKYKYNDNKKDYRIGILNFGSTSCHHSFSARSQVDNFPVIHLILPIYIYTYIRMNIRTWGGRSNTVHSFFFSNFFLKIQA